MKVGIVVYSHTGNTLAVAKRLEEKLLASGHTVNLEQVKAVNEDPSKPGKVELKTIPETKEYDVLVFGGPVQAFSNSPVMKAYLAQIQSLQGKKAGCFVTQHFPFPWMGGNRAIKQMKEACEAKAGNVFGTGIINWSHKQRELKITDLLEKLSRL